MRWHRMWQMAGQQFSLQERALAPSSWEVSLIKVLSKTEGVYAADIDQCTCGPWAKGDQGWAPVRKPTRILTNSRYILKEPRKRGMRKGGRRHCKTAGMGRMMMRIHRDIPCAVGQRAAQGPTLGGLCGGRNGLA